MSSPVSLLMLTNAITPDRVGGLERYVRELSDALARAGADVTIVTRQVNPDHPRRERTGDGALIVRYPTPSKSNPAYALGYPAAAMRAVIANVRHANGKRIVHSHFPLQGLGAVASRSAFVHTFHAPVHREVLAEHQGSYALPDFMRSGLRQTVKQVERRVVSRSEALITLSGFMAAEAMALGASPARMTQIPGGVDTVRFCPGQAIADGFARLGSGPLLFTARRLVPRTGVVELVRAMGHICRDVPGARLAVAGRGPLEAALRDEVRAMGLGDQVRLLGWVSEDDLVRWLRAADLVVLPTQELEGFGLATAEALACGTPVVGTPAGATPEILEQLDPSLLSADTTPESIADAVISALRHPDRLREVADRARAVIHPAMSWTHVAARHLDLYSGLPQLSP